MMNTSEDINLLHIDDDLPDDYPSSKSSRQVKPSISDDTIVLNSDDSLNLRVQPKLKAKKITKKTAFRRYIYPEDYVRSRSSTLEIDYYEQEKLQYQPPSPPQFMDRCDMRFLIIRHGERVDRYFGSNWFTLAFDQLGQYRPFHFNLPPNLPHRSNKYLWAMDTPLTRDGMNAAQNVGLVLGLNQVQPTYVYSSPATRCILTTYYILKGLGLESKIAIRMEPGLLELGAARFGMEVFLKPIEWYQFGVNVDLSYQPIMRDVAAIEREDEYYLRSKYVVRELEQRHGSQPNSSVLNILIVAHATSPDTLTWDLVGRQPNVYDLYTLSLNIGYLQMVITERTRQNKFWSLTQMPLQSTSVKWV